MNTAEEKKARAELACNTADQFIQLYYERMDKKRHAIDKLYLDTAILAWNGNKVEGANDIQRFLLEKVPTSEHEILSLDAQAVLDAAVLGQTTVAVCVAGLVSYKGKMSKPFQQNFLITAEGDKWRVASDSFRYQEISSTASASE